MKATGPAETSTPKASLSKSMKKSRLKATKSGRQSSSAPQPSSSDLIQSQPPSTECFREKSHQKTYSGFGPTTIKVFWEQYDTGDSDITHVTPEAYAQLAEDATYKIWDIVNTMKTYARHSGGRVTCDIVNEVLKDSDVPPMLGCPDLNRMEHDGNLYFNVDEDIDLCKEYMKDEDPVEVYPSGNLSTVWGIDRQNGEMLFDFSSSLNAAIFMGNDETFKYALKIATLAPHIGNILGIILNKCIELLVFEQKPKTVDRCMMFLRALVFNVHSHGVECREQLFHLAELFACLIFGVYEPEIRTESFELLKNFLESSETEMKKDANDMNQVDVDDIRNTYEALREIITQNGFQDGENGEVINTDIIKIETHDLDNDMEISETMEVETNATVNENNNIPQIDEDSTHTQPESPESNMLFSPYKTKPVQYSDIECVYLALGDLASCFGYFQQECLFLFVKRMERFFRDRDSFNEYDYSSLCRLTRALFTLGEYAFREITPYLNQIDPLIAPDWVSIVFNNTAIFLKGRDDIFLYEWLAELCGDKLQPFMLFFYKRLEKVTAKRAAAQRKATYKIPSKVGLRCVDRRMSETLHLSAVFPEAVNPIIVKKRIGFRYTGNRPIQPKAKSHYSTQTCFKQGPIDKFNERIVIAKRKLFKPLTNERRWLRLSNFCFTQI